MPSAARPPRTCAALLAALAAAACREGTSQSSDFIPIPLSSDGAHGCNGPNQGFPAPEEVDLSGLGFALGARSQLAAAQGAELVYVTAAGATLVELDFGAGSPPAATVLLDPALIAAELPPTISA